MSEQEEREPEDRPADDGFPAEDVTPEDPDPDLDVADPFGVGDDREPLEDGASDGGSDKPQDATEDDDASKDDELED